MDGLYMTLDLDRVYREVATCLADRIEYKLREEIWETVKSRVTSTLLAAVKEETAKVVRGEVLLGGKSVHQLVHDFLNGPVSHRTRTQLIQTIEKQIEWLSRDIVNDFLGPYAEKLKERVRNHVLAGLTEL